VLSFIYTRCAAAKACPYATGVLRQLHESSDGTALAKELRLVSMSFDPANDTPARMAAYSQLASARPASAPWHFVTTRSQAELQPILAAYGQAVDKKKIRTTPPARSIISCGSSSSTGPAISATFTVPARSTRAWFSLMYER